MKFAAGNAQHVGARPQQEDAFGFSDPTNTAFTEHAGFLGVVADGMGGMSRGREASQLAVRTFLRAYQAKAAAESIPDALLRSVVDSNNAVVSLSNGASGQTGTTLAAAVIHKDLLHWTSAGDSRIYLLRDGRLTRLTADHVYGRELDEKVAEGKISRTQARSHPERGSLTSYLGMKKLPELDRSVRPFPLNPRDCVIVCSDGFYRALSESEIVTAFRGELNSACDELMREALQKRRAQQDNLTVIALSNEPDSRGAQWNWARSALMRATLGFVIALFLAGALAGGVWHWIHRAVGASNAGASSSTTLRTGTEVSGSPKAGKPAVDTHPALRNKKTKDAIAGGKANTSAAVNRVTEVDPATPSGAESAGSTFPTGRSGDHRPKSLESPDSATQGTDTPKQADSSLPQREAASKNVLPGSLSPAPFDGATGPGSQIHSGANTEVKESKGNSQQVGTAVPGTNSAVEQHPEGLQNGAASSIPEATKKAGVDDEETHKTGQNAKSMIGNLKLKKKQPEQKAQQ